MCIQHSFIVNIIIEGRAVFHRDSSAEIRIDTRTSRL
jgi:hypothetical protein